MMNTIDKRCLCVERNSCTHSEEVLRKRTHFLQILFIAKGKIDRRSERPDAEVLGREIGVLPLLLVVLDPELAAVLPPVSNNPKMYVHHIGILAKSNMAMLPLI